MNKKFGKWFKENIIRIFVVITFLLVIYIVITLPFTYGEYKTFDDKGNLLYCKGDWKYCTAPEELSDCKTVYRNIKNK